MPGGSTSVGTAGFARRVATRAWLRYNSTQVDVRLIHDNSAGNRCDSVLMIFFMNDTITR
eukprot:m.47398 g.47398  ORF g.47398 m.47398 type:complete len:60 (+) comp13220_c1_seq9:398-577(+)